MKLLHWERGGFVIYHKYFEQGRISHKLFKKEEPGLYSKDRYNYYNTITTLENDINNWYGYGIYNTPYNFTPFQKRWWHFIYKIPRKW